MYWSTIRCAVLILLVLLPNWVQGQHSSTASAPVAVENLVRMGFHWNVFSGVERRDAAISLNSWASIIARDMGGKFQTTTEIIDDAQDLFNRLRDNSLDVAIVSAWEYLQYPDHSAFEPVISSIELEHPSQPHVLLVHKDSGITTLRHLQGKSIVINDYGVSDTALRWLDILLAREGLAEPEEFFSSITRSQTISKVVHPVFFRQVDASIANDTSLATLIEMNPQIQKNLKILATSPLIPLGIVFLRKDMEAEKRRTFLDSCLKLDTHAKGQQILTLFKIKRLARFVPETLEPVIAIHREWQQLRKSGSKAPHDSR
ncbi:MAG TPA: PhnD/SsuA/transferrin family substrate-binding protein [Candidatus Ozemobacteraceae bacterium]|nr:PhnD/SsuA/transferrin family substrate-binding protein [Candidatus Ozemobacteraceae bacterium]